MHARMTLLWRAVILTLLCALSMSFSLAQAPVADITKVLPDVLALIGTQETGPLQVTPGCKIAFMGDSITQQGGYVRLTAYVLNTKYPGLKPVFINTGVGGQKAENMEPRFEKDMKLAEKPAFTFISVGINDVWHRNKEAHDPAVLAAYKDNVAKMVDKGLASGAQVVLLTPTIIREDVKSEENTRLVMYVDAMKQVAAEKKCQVVDLHDLFLKALAAKPASLRITADGVHMNPYGDAIMAYGVLRALGVADATTAATDISGIFRVRALGTPLTQFAQSLEVPPTRFFNKPELCNLLGF